MGSREISKKELRVDERKVFYTEEEGTEDRPMSPEQAKRFSAFYLDLRNDMQDLYLCGHDPFLFMKMKEERASQKK
jgi:hypothetical protein